MNPNPAPVTTTAEDAQEVAADLCKLIESAPAHIWLDLGEGAELPGLTFRDLREVSWSEDNATGVGIKYVRAPVAVATSDADLPDSGDLHGLRAHFWAKHRECEKAAYALASALPIGDERNRVFDLYEIIRTAPRKAQS